MTSIEEHRALAEEDARHTDEPVTREHGIQWCQHTLAMFTPDDDRLNQLDDHGAGECDECGRRTLSLRKLGQFILCVDCILRRLHALAKSGSAASQPRRPEPVLSKAAV